MKNTPATTALHDFWAIQYGYTPFGAKTPADEKSELNKIASRSGDPMLPYGTDEDVFGNSMQGIDPYCNQRDLSNDPIAFYKDEISLSKELWSKIEERFEKPDYSHSHLHKYNFNCFLFLTYIIMTPALYYMGF